MASQLETSAQSSSAAIMASRQEFTGGFSASARAVPSMVLRMPLSSRFTPRRYRAQGPALVQGDKFGAGDTESFLIGEAAALPLGEGAERFWQGIGYRGFIYAAYQHRPQRSDESDRHEYQQRRCQQCGAQVQ